MPEITEKELPPNLKPLWLKALSAVQTSNLPYGISLLQAVLKQAFTKADTDPCAPAPKKFDFEKGQTPRAASLECSDAQ